MNYTPEEQAELQLPHLIEVAKKVRGQPLLLSCSAGSPSQQPGTNVCTYDTAQQDQLHVTCSTASAPRSGQPAYGMAAAGQPRTHIVHPAPVPCVQVCLRRSVKAFRVCMTACSAAAQGSCRPWTWPLTSVTPCGPPAWSTVAASVMWQDVSCCHSWSHLLTWLTTAMTPMRLID
jgi:hypothetical protein